MVWPALHIFKCRYRILIYMNPTRNEGWIPAVRIITKNLFGFSQPWWSHLAAIFAGPSLTSSWERVLYVFVQLDGTNELRSRFVATETEMSLHRLYSNHQQPPTVTGFFGRDSVHMPCVIKERYITKQCHKTIHHII